MAVGAGVVLALGCLLALGEAEAQKFYKWTDERGIVHFSDTAPPQGKYQVRDLPPPPPEPEEPPEEAVDGETPPTPPPTEGAAPVKTKAGPASLEISDQKEEAVGESTHQYRGKVKNVGGATASGVVVVIKVTDSNQGAECVNDEIEVRPSDLAPGETGTYAAEFTNPCFFGPTSATLRPDWE